MEKINHILMVLLLLVSFPAIYQLKQESVVSYSSTFIYIRPSGDDLRGDGSMLRPYRTLSKALEMATYRSVIVYQFPGEKKEMFLRPVREANLAGYFQ